MHRGSTRAPMIAKRAHLNTSTVSSALSLMAKEGKVVRVKTGEYRIAKRLLPKQPYVTERKFKTGTNTNNSKRDDELIIESMDANNRKADEYRRVRLVLWLIFAALVFFALSLWLKV